MRARARWIGLAALLPTPAGAASFADLLDHAAVHSTTAQVVALDGKMSGASVGSSVSRVLPMVSLSDSLTSMQLNEERYALDSETPEECEARQGRVCDVFVNLGGTIAVPDQTVSHNLSVMLTQPVWSTSAVLGVVQATTRDRIVALQGALRLEGHAWELVEAYVALQADVADLEIDRAALAVTEESLRATRAAHAVGDATDLDLELATFDLEKAEVDLAQSQRALPRALDGLWDTAGYRAGGPQEVCPLMPVSDTGAPLALDEATTIQLSERQAQLDRQGRTESRLSLLPSLNAIGGLSWTGSGDALDATFDDFGFNYWYAGGSLSWTLFSGLSRLHDNRSATWSVEQTTLETAQDRRDLALSDAAYAADLRDLAEDLALLDRELALQRRQLRATTSRYTDGGQVPLEMVLASRRSVTTLERERVRTHQQQVLTMARRWIDAGRADPLLAAMVASDRAHAAAGGCTELSP